MTQPSMPSAEYRLDFTASINPADSQITKEGFKAMTARFMALLNDPFTFGDMWLPTCMGDALMSAPENESEGEMENYFPVSHIEVEIWDEKYTFDEDEHKFEYSGTLSWSSVAVDKKKVAEAIDWRLGDRFSNYGLLDDDWYASFTPGELRIQEE